MTNFSLAVNTGSTLVLGCRGSATANMTTNMSPVFLLTKNSNVTGVATAASSNTSPFTFVPSGGNLIWSSLDGHSAGFDHFIASVSFPVITGFPASGFAQFYVPYLRADDSGSYFCNFFDGAGTVGTGTVVNSGPFTLTVRTLSASSSPRGASRSKAIEYSLALLGASKVLF